MQMFVKPVATCYTYYNRKKGDITIDGQTGSMLPVNTDDPSAAAATYTCVGINGQDKNRHSGTKTLHVQCQ